MHYTESYNDQFQEIEHYKKMPQMMPWVGKSYGDDNVKKILFIGESHYLDLDSEIHKKSKLWYSSSSQELIPKEKDWTNTVLNINEGKNRKYPSSAQFSIYGNIEKVILELYNPTDTENMLQYCAFYNYFQRPAQEKGQSIIYDSKDLEVADEVFLKIVKTIRPEYIFVTSSKVWPYVKEKSKELEIISDFSPHPGCAWWNRRAKKYGTNSDGKYLNGKGKVIIFLKEHSVFNTY
ncbi:MAG: hypothetical protein OEZ36_12440 [Spirochaetota bacterium]|nr:hypothetical protein [Spirochaetota bacterium]